MKRSPLKRKTSLRDSQIRQIKEKGTRVYWQRNGDFSRKKPLKKISKSHRRKLQEYYVLRNEFLADHPDCEICTRRRERGESIRLNGATEVHHRAGRGINLCNVANFIASCFPCRLWPHEHPREAREMGLLV